MRIEFERELLIRQAEEKDSGVVIAFFTKNLSGQNDAIYSAEFLCPMGVIGAIRKQQLLIAEKDGVIIAAIRFYRKKRDRGISLYQFAIARDFRGRGLLLSMLERLRDQVIVSLCPSSSSLNSYYEKQGWRFEQVENKFNTWLLPPKKASFI